MSSVTDIILVTALWDGSTDFKADPHPNVDSFIKYSGVTLEVVKGAFKNSKVIQCDLFIAAMNYYNEERAIDALNKVEWESPECVQLMMKGEHEDIFTIYTPKVNKPIDTKG